MTHFDHMNSAVVWPNTGKPIIASAVQQTVEYLREIGIRVYMPDFAEHLASEGAIVDYEQDCLRNANFAVVLGGDGTILAMARKAAEAHTPIIGINVGHLGFMSELDLSELPLLTCIKDGKYQIDSRMMLDIDVIRDGLTVFHDVALNEAIIKTGSIFRIASLDIVADCTPVCSLQADGVIVSTPTGTTAYAFAAGGPIVEPTAENLIVVPLCAHGMANRPYVFAQDREITVRPTSHHEGHLIVSADGREGFSLRVGDRVIIRKSRRITRLIRVKPQSFYYVLDQKLSGGFSN
ncbi:MAG: NAD(+)/NADH kinase [Butyricicoccaceae bacterium]